MQDAWLDSVEVDPKLAERISSVAKNDNEEQDLSSDDIGKIKRRIANALESGETVIMLPGSSLAAFIPFPPSNLFPIFTKNWFSIQVCYTWAYFFLNTSW